MPDLVRRRLLAAMPLAALPALNACTPDSFGPNTPKAGLPDVMPGDWVLRRGTGRDSFAIALISGSLYSHLAMVVEGGEHPKVVHAVTEDDKSSPDEVKVMPLDAYWGTKYAWRGLLVRPDFLSEQEKRKVCEHALARLHEPFSWAPRSEPHCYCTSLIYEAIISVKPDFQVRWSRYWLPTMTGEYLAPEAFLQVAGIRRLWSFDLKA